MIKILKTRRNPSTVLGLALDGSRLEGALLRRTNGHMQVLKTFVATLALKPLTNDPELVGREIRNQLEQAGIRERRCVVCLPLSWALTVTVKIPELPEADVASFLEIEAERGFPYSPEMLSLSVSRYRNAAGEQFATLVGVPRNYIDPLEKCLRAARLQPQSFNLGIAALQAPEKESSSGVLAVAANENHVDLQVTCSGGVLALRSVENVLETEGSKRSLISGTLAREIRVTLGQMPEEFRRGVRKVRMYGGGDLAQDLASRAASLGLQVEEVRGYATDEFRSQLPAGTAVTPATSLAARWLTGAKSCFEFLPPKVSALQQLTARFSSRKLGWIGGAAAAAALIVGGAVLFQHWQLSSHQSDWSRMESRVKELEFQQAQIRRFRPWFDESFHNLSILRRVTEAFPADGMVTAKTVEIRDQTLVTCTGVARDNQAFLKMLDQLRATKQIGSVQVDQVRGKTPMQFTVNFQWGDKANEN